MGKIFTNFTEFIDAGNPIADRTHVHALGAPSCTKKTTNLVVKAFRDAPAESSDADTVS